MPDMGDLSGSIEANAGGYSGTDMNTGGNSMGNSTASTIDPTGGVAGQAGYGGSSDTIDAATASNIDAMSFAATITGLGVGLASFMGAAAVAGDVPGIGTAVVVGGATVASLLGLTGQAMVGFAQSGAPDVMANNPGTSFGLYPTSADPVSYGSIGTDGTWTPPTPTWASDWGGNA